MGSNEAVPDVIDFGDNDVSFRDDFLTCLIGLRAKLMLNPILPDII